MRMSSSLRHARSRAATENLESVLLARNALLILLLIAFFVAIRARRPSIAISARRPASRTTDSRRLRETTSDAAFNHAGSLIDLRERPGEREADPVH
jgi:hypothetical protein